MVASSCDLGWHVNRSGGASRSERDYAKPLPRETAMPPQTIENRVEKLEEHVTSLQQLPARVDALSGQIVRSERALREEILASEERILGQVRMLHEDVISRLALIQEGSQHPRRRRS